MQSKYRQWISCVLLPGACATLAVAAEPQAPAPVETPAAFAPAPGQADPSATATLAETPPFETIQLPRYVVKADEVPKFTERDILTPQGRLTLAQQRYIHPFCRDYLNRWRLPIIGGGMDAFALQMYADDERLQAMTELEQHVTFYKLSGDTRGAIELKDEIQRAFIRKPDFTAARPRRN